MHFTVQLLSPAQPTTVIARDGVGFSRADAAAILGGDVEPLFPAMRKDIILVALAHRSSFDHGNNREAHKLFMKGQVFGPVLVVPFALWKNQSESLSKAA